MFPEVALSHTRRVPNQEEILKFLIREEFTVCFRASEATGGNLVSFQNGTAQPAIGP
jgi:hypothetical protein